MWALVVIVFLGSTPTADGRTVVTTIPAFASEGLCSAAARTMGSSGDNSGNAETWMTAAKCVREQSLVSVAKPAS